MGNFADEPIQAITRLLQNLSLFLTQPKHMNFTKLLNYGKLSPMPLKPALVVFYKI